MVVMKRSTRDAIGGIHAGDHAYVAMAQVDKAQLAELKNDHHPWSALIRESLRRRFLTR